MRRGRGLVLAAIIALLCPTWLLAQERGEGERPKGREAERGKEPMTPEQMAERQKQFKAGLERQAGYVTNMAKGCEARRDELKAMAGKETLTATPPPPQLFGSQALHAGANLGMRAAMMARRGPDPRGGQPGREGFTPPGTFEVANTDELKKAIAKAVEAYGVAIPLFDEQKKGVEAMLKQAEAGGEQDPAAVRGRFAASQELMAKVTKAQAAVGDAESTLQLLLAKAWLAIAKEKVAGDEAKAAAAKATEALDKYLALKAQLDELAQKIDEQATAIQEGLGKVLPSLAPPRGGGDERGGPRDGGGREGGGREGGERREERPAPRNGGNL